MIVTIKQGADAQAVQRELAARGLWVKRFEGGGRVQLAVEPHSSLASPDELARIAGVESVAVEKAAHPKLDEQPKVVLVSGVPIGIGAKPVLMAGPCAVESEAQVKEIAARLAPQGVRFLRGGAYKPRTSPYAFQGHGEEALKWLRRAADETGLKVVTEAMAAEEVPLVAEYADLVQIGSRNMHNYALLRTIGRTRRPVLLKRGMAATVDEWLLAGEYCLQAGAASVIFCERGVRSFDSSTRNLLDLAAVALLAHVHRVPVIADPSHGTGRRELVVPLGLAALAAGAAGLLVEAHHDPGKALSDGPQAIAPEALAAFSRGQGGSDVDLDRR